MNSDRDTSRLTIFVALSLLLHIAAAAALYFLAPKKAGPPLNTPYVVSLVPDESQPPPTPVPPPPALKKRVPFAKRPLVPLKKIPHVVESEPKPKEFNAEGGKPEETEKREPVKRKLAEIASKEKEGGEKPGKGTVSATKPGGETASEKPGFMSETLKKKEAESETESGGTTEGEGLGSKFLDKDVLAKVIEKGREEENKNSSITFDTKEIRHWGYMQRLKERIEYVWEYPRSAALKGIYGDLVLRFVIKKDGELGAIDLVRTSGWQDLDKAAMRALKDGAPYWPLPDDWDSDSITVTGHFIYTLDGYYLR